MPTLKSPEPPLPDDYYTADRSDVILGVGITFVVLEVISFGLRLIARKIIGTKQTWDDVLVILGLLCNLVVCAYTLVSSKPFWQRDKSNLRMLA